MTKCPDKTSIVSNPDIVIDYFNLGTTLSTYFTSFTKNSTLCSITYSLVESDGVTSYNTSRIASFDVANKKIDISINERDILNTVYVLYLVGKLNN